MFTNVSGFGPVDMVCVKTQGKGKPTILLVDVKIKTKRSYGGISDEQRWAGVQGANRRSNRWTLHANPGRSGKTQKK